MENQKFSIASGYSYVLHTPTGDIKAVQAIFEEVINVKDAESLLNFANGDIDIIKKKYEIAKVTSDIKGLMGWMLDAIKGDYQLPKGKKRVGSFNDYEQRSYDFDKLERKLLGWDINEMDDVGEEYQQAKYLKLR